jgi:hypothetical protein
MIAKEQTQLLCSSLDGGADRNIVRESEVINSSHFSRRDVRGIVGFSLMTLDLLFSRAWKSS